ncbi:MAG: DNA recombination protein RmuC [Proteobacteria bacterium]|nr:MAG: DNA recombination protein RmuC [Pseudomonadota bacterium]
MEIVNRGEKLYEKFVAFASTLEDIGKHIDRAQQSFGKAKDQLNSGGGNLVGHALKLRSLGLKSSKEMPGSMLSVDFEQEEKPMITDHLLDNDDE